MKHHGNLTITKDNLWKYQEITEVSGSVDIMAENASLPALTEVSGSVDIMAENASLPALTEVSGYVYAQPSSEVVRARLAEVAHLSDAAARTWLNGLISISEASAVADTLDEGGKPVEV